MLEFRLDDSRWPVLALAFCWNWKVGTALTFLPVRLASSDSSRPFRFHCCCFCPLFLLNWSKLLLLSLNRCDLPEVMEFRIDDSRWLVAALVFFNGCFLKRWNCWWVETELTSLPVFLLLASASGTNSSSDCSCGTLLRLNCCCCSPFLSNDSRLID